MLRYKFECIISFTEQTSLFAFRWRCHDLNVFQLSLQKSQDHWIMTMQRLCGLNGSGKLAIVQPLILFVTMLGRIDRNSMLTEFKVSPKSARLIEICLILLKRKGGSWMLCLAVHHLCLLLHRLHLQHLRSQSNI